MIYTGLGFSRWVLVTWNLELSVTGCYSLQLPPNVHVVFNPFLFISPSFVHFYFISSFFTSSASSNLPYVIMWRNCGKVSHPPLLLLIIYAFIQHVFFIASSSSSLYFLCFFIFAFASSSSLFISNCCYRNVPKFSDRQIWANSADPDQTATRGANIIRIFRIFTGSCQNFLTTVQPFHRFFPRPLSASS